MAMEKCRHGRTVSLNFLGSTGVLLLAIALCLQGCEKHEYSDYNSPKYLAQFGIVRGQTANVEVADVRFRIPPRYPISATSHLLIREGHADFVYFSLDFTQTIEGTGPVVSNEDPMSALTNAGRHGAYIHAGVRVEISHYNGESHSMAKNWPQDQISEQWGLRGYAGDYESIVERTPNGNPVQFFCVSTEACFGRFEYPKGIVVTYDIDRSMLPYWKIIYEGTLKTVDSFLPDKK